MSKVFAILENNRVINRVIFATTEDAESIVGVGNFVEETEEIFNPLPNVLRARSADSLVILFLRSFVTIAPIGERFA